MSNGLDPGQDQRFVGTDLGLNCLKKLISRRQKLLLAKESMNIFMLLTSELFQVVNMVIV